MKIELLELKRIASVSQNTSDEINKNLNLMSNLLESLCANVNSSELSSVNTNLIEAIDDISLRVKNNFPTIIDFLNNQVASYERANEITKQKINSLLSSLDGTLN